MRRTRFDRAPCPIARTADLLGDWWTPLVLRSFFQGAQRFEEIQTQLAIPRAVLSQRLRRLTEDGLLERQQAEHARPSYHLTAKGRAAWSVLAAMWQWGDEWLWPSGQRPSVVLRDRATGAVVRPIVVDQDSGRRIDELDVTMSRRRSGE